MRTQNVILFSAGESVRSGKAEYIKQRLRRDGIHCMDWRELFRHAHDAEHLALLPSLVKKIPTFDFALIFAEGVDEVKLRGDAPLYAMRDNILFELGLCVMGLGSERVILLAEEGLHIPDDLAGVGTTGIQRITFSPDDFETPVNQVEQLLTARLRQYSKQFTAQLDQVIRHINRNADTISPVFVGAAVSSAEAYFMNFIVRLLENMENGFQPADHSASPLPFPRRTQLYILFPSGGKITPKQISDCYLSLKAESFVIPNAGPRGLFFHALYSPDREQMTILDIPTSVTASYSVIRSILNIDSDEDYDRDAEQRFTTKEMDTYRYALQKLLSPALAAQRLTFLRDDEKKAQILRRLQTVQILSTTVPSETDSHLL